MSVFGRLLGLIPGMNFSNIAREAEQRGYGESGQIQRALETGDGKGLSFVPKLAEDIARRNPQMAAQVSQMLGVKNPFSGSR